MRGIIELVSKKSWWDIILICLIGLVSISWFQGEYLITWADYWFPADRISYLSNITSAWVDRAGLGVTNFRGVTATPYGIYLAATEIVGITPVIAEKTFFYISFTSAGLSMYYLSYVIGLGRVWRIIAALFYMMNPAAISYLLTPFIFAAYACAPLLLGLYINGLKQNRRLRYIIFLALVWLVTTSYTYVDPIYLIIHIFIFVSYLVFFIIVHRDSKLAVQAIRFTTILFLFFLFLNAFWLIPLSSGVQEEIARAQIPGTASEDLFRGLSASLTDALRLLGYGEGLLLDYKGDPYNQWAPWYFRTPTILIALLIPITAFLALLWRGRGRIYLYYFGLLAMAGLFLTTGANPPLGEANLWLMKKIPYLVEISRNPLKFQMLIALAFAPLLGMGIFMVYRLLVGKWRNLPSGLFIVVVFVVLLAYYPLPYWTGDIYRGGGEVLPSTRVKVPGYYSDARQWLTQLEEDSRILALPVAKSYGAHYKWEYGYHGANPDGSLLNKPSVGYNDGSHSYQPVMIIGDLIDYQSYEQSSDISVPRWLGILGVQYVMLHRDMDWEYIKDRGEYFNRDLVHLEAFLENQTDLQWIKSFGLLDFYAVKKDHLLPHIYSTSSAVLVDGDLDTLFPLITLHDFDIHSTIFLSEDEADSSIIYELLGNYGYEYKKTEVLEAGNDFESGKFRPWLRMVSPDDSALISNADSHKGNYSAELTLSGPMSTGHIYRDFPYDAKSHISINAWMKVVSRTFPGDASIYIRGYDANGVERARIIYYTYDNTDYRTATPEQNGQTYYVLKTHLGDPPYDTWMKVDQNPKDEFEAQFPDVWENLDLVRIRMDLSNWCDGAIRSRYDDVTITGTLYDPTNYLYFFPKNESDNTPEVNFQKIAPTAYQVHINTAESLFLVLSESYHPQWKAYINAVGKETNWIEAFYREPLSEDNHLLVNGYANAWYIDRKGEYDVTLLYWPQTLFYLGFIISGLSFVGCVGYLIGKKIFWWRNT